MTGVISEPHQNSNSGPFSVLLSKLLLLSGSLLCIHQEYVLVRETCYED